MELEEALESIVRRMEEHEMKSFDVRRRMESHEMIRKIEDGVGDVTVGAVDSGFKPLEYGGFVVLPVRTVGLEMEYRGGRLKGYRVHTRGPNYFVNEEELENEDVNAFVSINRMREEVLMALDMEVDVVFMDGSLVPHSADRPRNPYLLEEYRELVSLLDSLYEREPVGIVKDSRSSRIAKMFGLRVPDVVLLSRVLKEGEYTEPVQFSEEEERVYVMYIKLGHLFPLRVEFVSSDPLGRAEEIASILRELTPPNPYSMPPFMIEVDMRARLGSDVLEHAKSAVERRVLSRYPYLLTGVRPF